MRFSSSILAVTLLPGTAFAQTPVQNQTEIYPGTTSATSRPGRRAGETLQGFARATWSGIGDSGTIAQITGLSSVSQDQNGQTQETFHWIVRSGNDTMGPTAGTAGEIAAAGLLITPPSSTRTAVVWALSTALSTPVTVLHDSFFAVGHRLSAGSPLDQRRAVDPPPGWPR